MALASTLSLGDLATAQLNTAASLPRFALHGIPIDRVTLDEAAAWVISKLKARAGGAPLLIMGPNAQLITLAARNPRFAEALRSAKLSVPDGISVVLASRWLGQPVPERVTGGDLMERLCIESARHGLSVFLLGGLPGAAERTARKFEERYPGFRTAGVCCPPVGFERDPGECERIRQQIAEAKPDLLCVALGAPKQEIWMLENCASLPVGAAISVGAALDTQAGLRKRAPKWTHRIGLEWLYRLVREPRRLWRRYLIGNTEFLVLVGREWWQQRRQRPARERTAVGTAPAK
ncbi:MAG TPA: WecB/TagA/CpsF family glycosyltransferase [Acidobacteriaceae bacterium]|nr:WecB/TagA/CpsF family glycosyltransferase [Acidobacteriaceae bacterium]